MHVFIYLQNPKQIFGCADPFSSLLLDFFCESTFFPNFYSGYKTYVSVEWLLENPGWYLYRILHRLYIIKVDAA